MAVYSDTEQQLLTTVLAVTPGSAAWCWGLARSLGSLYTSEALDTSDVIAQPQLIPRSLFCGATVCCVSAGWGHTAFVTGTCDFAVTLQQLPDVSDELSCCSHTASAY